MTAMSQVKEYLATLPEEQPFPSNALRRIASTDNIRQILNRLVKVGEPMRLARGVFAKPRHTKSGIILPSARATVETLAKSRGETVAIQGAEAARQLQLTTQVPLRTIFYTSGNSRTLKIANRIVELKHTPPSINCARYGTGFDYFCVTIFRARKCYNVNNKKNKAASF